MVKTAVGSEFLIQKPVQKWYFAYRPKTAKVRIFIMAGDGILIWKLCVITGRLSGKHVGDFSCPSIH